MAETAGMGATDGMAEMVVTEMAAFFTLEANPMCC